jgi:sulfonate dioxygenase
MAPPNTDAIIQEIEKLNLQTLARTKGHYIVYPDTKVCTRWIFQIIIV